MESFLFILLAVLTLFAFLYHEKSKKSRQHTALNTSVKEPILYDEKSKKNRQQRLSISKGDFTLAAHLSAARARSLLAQSDYADEIFNQAGYRWGGTSEAWENIASQMTLEKINACPQ